VDIVARGLPAGRKTAVVLIDQAAITIRRSALVDKAELVFSGAGLEAAGEFGLDTAQWIDHLFAQQLSGRDIVTAQVRIDLA